MKLFDLLFPFKSPKKDLDFELSDKRALIIASSQDSLDHYDKNGVFIKKGMPTGVHSSELTEAYYAFNDAGISVTLASIKGGAIPLDPFSLRPFIRTEADRRMLGDQNLQADLENSMPIDQAVAEDYDLIYLAGGWAAAYDFEQSAELASLISEAYAQKKWIASVCHGALGLCSAVKEDGTPLVEGLNISGVSNRQLKQLFIMHTPKHPEDSLKAKGANYQFKPHLISDLFSLKVVEEQKHRIISGQNQKAALEVAKRCLQRLSD